MNPLDPFGILERYIAFTTGAFKLAAVAPRLALQLLQGNHHDEQATATVVADRPRPVADRPRPVDVPVPPPPAPPAARPSVRPPRSTARAATPPRPPAGNRRVRDTAPEPHVPTPEPSRAEIDRRREEIREAEAAEPTGLVESEGAAAPKATIRVDAPWDGYDKMKASDVVARVKSANAAEKAVVRLYEQTHRKRKSILTATS